MPAPRGTHPADAVAAAYAGDVVGRGAGGVKRREVALLGGRIAGEALRIAGIHAEAVPLAVATVGLRGVAAGRAVNDGGGIDGGGHTALRIEWRVRHLQRGSGTAVNITWMFTIGCTAAALH